jgi:oleandomycin transport system permease protein
MTTSTQPGAAQAASARSTQAMSPAAQSGAAGATPADAAPAGTVPAGAGAGPPGVGAARRAAPPLAGLRHGATLTWRSLLKIKHSPEQLLDITLQPIVFVLLFVFLFGGAIAGDWREYLQFVLPGILVQTVVFATLGTGIGLATDIDTGIFDRFRSLPIARSAPLVGTVAGDVVRYIISAGVVLGFGMLLGFRVHTSPLAVLAAYGLVLVFAVALCWVAALVGLVMKKPRSVQAFGFIVMFPLTFGSNIFTQTSTLPGWLQTWVNVNPVTALTTATRGLLLGGPVAESVVHTLLWAVGIVAVFAPLAVSVYRRRA